MDDATPPADPAPADLERAMRFDPMTGLVDLEPTIASLRAEADGRGIAFDRHAVRNELQAATFRLRVNRCVRLLVSPTGAVAIEVYPEP